MDPLIGRILLDRYEVLRRIGAGGMGSVYTGRQLAVGREVALKVLRGELLSNDAVRQRFRREAEITGHLRHPNTIQLIDYGETPDGLAVMVMELLVGQSLSDRLRQFGPMALAETLKVGMEVAGSLAEAHGLGMVHRDLKPANIFLVDVGGKIHAKVLDFGIARILDEEATRITSTGQVFGTPRYMSPEQGMATGEVDSRADIYSLGLILYECLVGQPPFVAETSLQYLSAHAMMAPPKLGERLSSAPPALERLIDACLAKDRAQRVQTANEVAEALRRMLVAIESGQPIADDPSGAGGGGPRKPSRLPGGEKLPRYSGLFAVAGVALFLSLGGLYFASRNEVVPEATGLGGADAGANSSTDPADAAGGSAVAAVLGAADATVVADAAEPVRDVGADAADTTNGDGAVAALQPGHGLRYGDAGMIEAESSDAGELKPPKHVINKTKNKEKWPAEGPPRAIGGPRAMWIPIESEEGEGPVARAKACQHSKLPEGPAKLSLEPCGRDCAVIVDGVCGGRTPISGRSVPAGNKNVTVVCGNRVVIDQIARFRDGETTKLSCQ